MTGSHDWTHVPTPARITEMALQRSLRDSLLNAILDIIQDGLCIVDVDCNIIYSNVAMRHWYGVGNRKPSAKCYARFHDLEHPCTDCPAQRAIACSMPQTGMQTLEKDGRICGRQRLFCVPILDSDGKPRYVVEYIRDITSERRAESIATLLEKQNEALKDHLRQQEEQSKRNEQSTSRNLEFVVSSLMASLEKLLDERSLLLIQEHLSTLMRDFGKQIPPWSRMLSEQEIAIARYIVDGCASKEIAEKLNVSKKTVDYHRANIRKKLKLESDENLRKRLVEVMYQMP